MLEPISPPTDKRTNQGIFPNVAIFHSTTTYFRLRGECGDLKFHDIFKAVISQSQIVLEASCIFCTQGLILLRICTQGVILLRICSSYTEVYI